MCFNPLSVRVHKNCFDRIMRFADFIFSPNCLPFHLYFPHDFRVFPVMWKIAKIFLDPKTRAKCVVLKSSELHKLCEYFNPEDLPEEFGGSCRCEDGCLPPIPKHMVRPSQTSNFS